MDRLGREVAGVFGGTRIGDQRDPGAGPVIAPRSLLKGIIAPRVEETLELLRDRLKASGAPVEAGAGLVLTGGASQLATVTGDVAAGYTVALPVRVDTRTAPAAGGPGGPDGAPPGASRPR